MLLQPVHLARMGQHRVTCCVSFLQACMKIFWGAGIVGCRGSSLRRTADEDEKASGSYLRIWRAAGDGSSSGVGVVRATLRSPSALWAEAVTLAGRYGVSRTARTLRVGYRSLQERVERKTGCLASSSPTAWRACVSGTGNSFAGGHGGVPSGMGRRGWGEDASSPQGRRGS